MEKLNSICLNIRVAFRKRDKDSMILFSNMLWEHLDNEGWKVSEDYWVYNDKHLLDKRNSLYYPILYVFRFILRWKKKEVCVYDTSYV